MKNKLNLTFDEYLQWCSSDKMEEGIVDKYSEYAGKQVIKKLTLNQLMQGKKLQTHVDRYHFHKGITNDPTVGDVLRYRSARKMEAHAQKIKDIIDLEPEHWS
jgi:hypothetical protein